ncbi:TLC domain-containing protein 5-like [Ostrea edulis]|uniref:TLC domain-containing protein 5-like n=1 Tax=Ostrea edulis TaxID=37623 RepID=UPI0024AE96FF|nr:TLC domain-containing protein 5-like [Ostrea edulis]XP_048777567.2 TLC domain-containing protein 5-like [Ostrea edulis]XP_048777568.2 TLC domain-containing protein 5-like [Ostrea edulis]XP_056009919.1 TLC domain-containing protein 5-like [Ostrea edulis]
MENSLGTVSGFSFLWCSLYFGLCHWKPLRSNEWHCRTVTAIHAVVVCLLCLWCAFVQGPWPFTEAGGPSTPLQSLTGMICLGYFLFDLSWCLYFQTEGLPMLLHHVCSILGMTIATMTGKYGTEMIATMFGSEITNPLLQIRWFLRETGNYETILGEIIDHAFMFLFGFFRIGIGSYLLYTYFQQDTDFWGRLGGITIYAISWMFWLNILVYAVKKYKKRFQNRQRKKFKSNADSLTNKNGMVANGDSFNSYTQTSCGVKELSNDSVSNRPEKQCNGYTKKSL